MPVLNGLLYSHGSDLETLTVLLDLFNYKWPLEVYKDTLYAVYNLLLRTEFSIAQCNIVPLCKFLFDIAALEFNVLRKPQSYLIDCYQKINPNYNDQVRANEAAGEGLTVAQLQRTEFCSDLYLIKGS